MAKSNLTLALSFDQRRRQIRQELFIQRQIDCDQTNGRLLADAKKLDTQLEAEGYSLPYKTEWGDKSNGRAMARKATAQF